MPRGVQYQGDFSGGQWSPEAGGRLDHPWQSKAMALCYNAVISEGGQFVRRRGTCWLAPTYQRTANAVVRPIFFSTADRHMAVISTDGTNGHLHLFRGRAAVYDDSNSVVGSSSTGGTLTITTNTATGWAVGDHVFFNNLPTTGFGYLNRWLLITAISTTTITLNNDIGLGIGFDSAANALNTATVCRVFRKTLTNLGFTTSPLYASIVNIGNVSGSQMQAVILHPDIAPQVLTLTSSGAGAGPDVFTFGALSFTDGPYQDPQGFVGGPTPTYETGTVSGYSGSITFTPQTSTFVAADVGRQIRLLTEPTAWASGTTYNVGDVVTYGLATYYKCVYGGVSGVTPGTLYTSAGGTQYLVWSPYPKAAQWAWGTITAQAGASCTVSLQTSLLSVNGTTVTQWRLGRFKSGAYPNCGILHEGRLWLGGAVEGYLDGSVSDQPFVYSPTDTYGNVFDNHALALKLAAPSADKIRWFRVDRSGLLFGTSADEYMMNGGGVDTPITPANFNIRRVSGYGSSYVQAVTAAFSHVFVQLYGLQVYEFVTDVFASSPSGRRLNPFQQDLFEGAGSITDLCYTENKVPALWMTTGVGGLLLSCSYRRFSRFMSSPPDLAAWAQHGINDNGVAVRSVAMLDASRDGELADYVYMITQSNDGTLNGVQCMQVTMEGA